MKKRTLFVYLVLLVSAGILLVCSVLFFLGFNQKKNLFRDLAREIESQAASVDFNYSLIIKDLDLSCFEIATEPDKSVAAASLLKLPILAAAFTAVDEGKISLDTIVKIEKKDITGGSGKLKAMQLPVELTLREVLELMISISDNTATNKVIGLLGAEYINEVFGRLGLRRTSLCRKMMDFSLRRKGVENYTCASDIALLLEKIYHKDLVSEDFSRLALSFLKKQKVSDRIPRHLPEETVIAHKTGLERGVVHDAGIVFGPKGDYVICVLLDNVRSYETGKKFIAQVSLLTYNLYDSQEELPVLFNRQVFAEEEDQWD
jgi:beta-lactamase class A